MQIFNPDPTKTITGIWPVAAAVTPSTDAPAIRLGLAPRACTIKRVYLRADTAPTGADLIVDVLKNGVSIWASTPANRAKIAAGATAGESTTFDTNTLADGDILTVLIAQVGSTVAGGAALYVRLDLE
jgi:hypothetical protein